MPVTDDLPEDLAGLKQALLNFIVTEIRAHGDDVGPLSPKLVSTVQAGVTDAVAKVLEGFDRAKAAHVAEAMWPALERELLSVRNALLGDVAAGIDERLNQIAVVLSDKIAEQTESYSKAAITDALGQSSVKRTMAQVDRRLNNLQLGLSEAIEGRLASAAAQVRQGAREAPASPPAEDDKPLAGERPRLQWLFPVLAVVSVLVIIAVADVSAVLVGWLPPQFGLGGDPASPDPLPAQYKTVDAAALQLVDKFNANARSAASMATLFGPDVVRRDQALAIAVQARASSHQAAAIGERAALGLRVMSALDGNHLAQNPQGAGGGMAAESRWPGQARAQIKNLSAEEAKQDRALGALNSAAAKQVVQIGELAQAADQALANVIDDGTVTATGLDTQSKDAATLAGQLTGDDAKTEQGRAHKASETAEKVRKLVEETRAARSAAGNPSSVRSWSQAWANLAAAGSRRMALEDLRKSASLTSQSQASPPDDNGAASGR